MHVRARKRYGQHFLIDHSVTEQIINSLDFKASMDIVEIGPGRGALTKPLLDLTRRLHVIEIDNDLAEHLRTLNNDQNKLIIHNLDVLEFDFCKSIGTGLLTIGNLPYNISTPLIFHLLDQIQCFRQMIFMLQMEVADRICASPGSKEFGRLSVMVQCMCRTERLFDVNPEAFTPRPKVKSTVIKLIPHADNEHQPVSVDTFKSIVRSAFSKRRKTIRNALRDVASEEALIESGIDPNQRPETLEVNSYIRLSNKLYNLKQNYQR